MIQIDAIKTYYPEQFRDNANFSKYILKEYLQLMILDYLSTSPYVRKITFIGGTSIRLMKGIDRFSEDLDFDCKTFSHDEFTEMTNKVLQFLRHNGLNAEVKDKENPKLKAFRRNIHFPELLFSLGLTGHRDERFLIKIESQDQLVSYNPEMVNIKGCGFFFPMPVPPASVLCAMKVSAMLDRQKGRDFYDAMFLLSQTMPDFNFLSQRMGISNLDALKKAAEIVIKNIDLKIKMRDFEHLLFYKNNSARILHVAEFFRSL
ncbi:MAG: nucleotidyl transferase AbiEii/AbiGii toxin family protein [Bacteroidota bacterium]